MRFARKAIGDSFFCADRHRQAAAWRGVMERIGAELCQCRLGLLCGLSGGALAIFGTTFLVLT
jgi:hypothetical protein